MKIDEFIKQIEERLNTFQIKSEVINKGTVEEVKDGIVKATGLTAAGFGEQVVFEDGSTGLVLGLDEDYVFIVLLESSKNVSEGQSVQTTGKLLSIQVSEELIGRVIDPLKNPLDQKPIAENGKIYPLEKIAPGVIERQPVNTPLKTGVKAIDALIPIGRGQRELIIGDRGTGKTAIAIDTIINQKKMDLGLKQVICIYCAIGQKRGNIAKIVAKLEEKGGLDYTIVVAATASDPAPLQYIAPYTACAIGEYFMDQGQDVLVVYDDLSKHAWAYRQLSLLLRRPAGREAYPGDIFYLHSKLLERAARLSDKKGGGSLTALPIIETQANDVSSYIPTNVISITDGQIYLETDLFNAGIRPAINIGLSVSRVGGAAQTGIMKQTAGPLKLELSQYRELASFAQFGSDLDTDTARRIERGKKVTEILKQGQYSPFDEFSQVVSILLVSFGFLDDIPVSSMFNFEEKFLSFIQVKNKKLVERIKTGKKLDEESLDDFRKIAQDFKKIQSTI